MSYTGFERITVSVTDGIGTVALTGRDALNRVDERMHEELAQVFTRVARDPAIRVVVLTGHGQHFCAGGDLEWMRDARLGQCDLPSIEDAKAIIFSLLDLRKPVIAKISGACVGLGATLALFCDTIFAAGDATISDPHVKVGIVAGDGGAIIWPQLIGYARAKEYLMTGDGLSGARAAEIGLINHAVDPDALDQTVQAYAERLRDGAYQAICSTKVAVNIGLKQLAHSILDASVAYEMETFRTHDHAEAVDAFLEKRAPRFQGR